MSFWYSSMAITTNDRPVIFGHGTGAGPGKVDQFAKIVFGVCDVKVRIRSPLRGLSVAELDNLRIVEFSLGDSGRNAEKTLGLSACLPRHHERQWCALPPTVVRATGDDAPGYQSTTWRDWRPEVRAVGHVGVRLSLIKNEDSSGFVGGMAVKQTLGTPIRNTIVQCHK